MSTDRTQKIGLVTATVVGVNAMIGAGIFSVPAALSSHVGPAGLITYAFVIVAIYFMGQSLSRLAQLYPTEGSFYTYASQWGGHIMGIISGGAYILGVLTAMGLLVQFAGNYLHVTFPSVSGYGWGSITLVVLTILNIVGVHLSRAGQLVLVCCTTFPIIATILVCITHGDSSNYTPFMPYGLQNVFSATKAVIFGFFGFEAAASLFNIVKNPEKNVPRALVAAILVVGTLYILFVAAIIYAIPLNLLDPAVPLSQSLKVVFPNHPWILGLIHFSILSAIVGTVHSMIWSASELILSYLNNLGIPKVNSLIAEGKLTHRSCVIFTGLAIFISFTTLKSVDLFFSLTATLIVFAFTTSLITLLTRKDEWKSGQNYKTIIGLLTAGVIFYFAVEGILTYL